MTRRFVTTATAAIGALLITSATQAAGGDARLVDAARNRDVTSARKLVRIVDVNAAPVDGATALHWAAHWDDLELAKVLLAAKADPNRANDYGVTPLWLACTNASAPMVKLLLAAGANVNAHTTNDESALMEASRTGSADVVRSLLAAKADPNVADKYRGQTAIMWAIAEGHVDVVRALLDAGADVHARTKPDLAVATPKSRGGSTPLIFAAREGNLALVKLLVEKGARVNDRPADEGSTPLLVATVRGHVDVAVWLLDQGADPNVKAAGFTPLHWAVGVWDSLLTHDTQLEEGELARIRGIATEPERARLISALLAHGANIEERVVGAIPHFGGDATGANEGQRVIEFGATPYLIAAMSGNAPVMRQLAAAGADTKARGDAAAAKADMMRRGSNAVTALLAAAGQGHVISMSTVPESEHLQAVITALELGADINETDRRGLTALHSAAYVGFDQIIKYLVEHGANVNAADVRGRTPLDVAESDLFLGSGFTRPETAALLRKLGGHKGTCEIPKDDPLGYVYCSTEGVRDGAGKDLKAAR